jgi:2-methylcitrate dehydratase PrpD
MSTVRHSSRTASDPTLLQRMSGFAAGVSYDALPGDVIESVKQRILDTIGICLAAAHLATSKMALELVRTWGGPQEATVIGFGQRCPVSSAGFVNGVLAHSLDFDDTHLPSVLHPSASIIPTALAVGEATGASGRDVIAASAAGYEICVRTGMAAYDRALGNSVFFERGWHATSICGALAAAVVAAKLYGQDAGGIGHALGIATSMGSGILEANRAGGSVKRLHCGWAAHSGIIAAQAARAGITSPLTAFEGRFGFYQAFCGGQHHDDEITGGLGSDWCVPGIFYKPYPTNHFTHAGIDAALRLRDRVRIDEIDYIELGVASPTLRTIAQPAEEKARPQSGYHAQFSGPFTVAAALIGGSGLGVGLDDFTDERVHDKRYLDLAAKVHCVASPECDAIFPNQFPALLTIRTVDGKSFEERVLANRGGPGNPLTPAELFAKFSSNAGGLLSASGASNLAGAIASFEDQPLRKLLSLTSSKAQSE